ncbi:MAG: hypothetical protein QM682_04890 [Paracoccus sp. (in: a-proteobacteria)]|uniref:hypothetical protein n=1 Tax=Paracoccus sp. TaxID=267 RepID=UPI0039E3CACA
MITRACGAGWAWLNFCPAKVSEFDRLGERHAALLAARESRIEVLRRAPQCRAPEPAAQPQPEEQAAQQCQPPPTDETLVLVDVSFSMEIDYNLPPTCWPIPRG